MRIHSKNIKFLMFVIGSYVALVGCSANRKEMVLGADAERPLLHEGDQPASSSRQDKPSNITAEQLLDVLSSNACNGANTSQEDMLDADRQTAQDIVDADSPRSHHVKELCSVIINSEKSLAREENVKKGGLVSGLFFWVHALIPFNTAKKCDKLMKDQRDSNRALRKTCGSALQGRAQQNKEQREAAEKVKTAETEKAEALKAQKTAEDALRKAQEETKEANKRTEAEKAEALKAAEEALKAEKKVEAAEQALQKAQTEKADALKAQKTAEDALKAAELANEPPNSPSGQSIRSVATADLSDMDIDDF